MEYTARCTECNHEIVGYDLKAMIETVQEYTCMDCGGSLCEMCVKWKVVDVQYPQDEEVPVCNDCAVTYMLEDLGTTPELDEPVRLDKDGNIIKETN